MKTQFQQQEIVMQYLKDRKFSFWDFEQFYLLKQKSKKQDIVRIIFQSLKAIFSTQENLKI